MNQPVYIGVMLSRQYLPFLRTWWDSVQATNSLATGSQCFILALDGTVQRFAQSIVPEARVVESRLVEQYGKPRRHCRTFRTWVWSLEAGWSYWLQWQALNAGVTAVFCDVDTCFFGEGLRGIPEPDTGHRMLPASIGVTPHYFPKGQEHRDAAVGRYNFGFATFAPNLFVADLLRDWAKWCQKNCDDRTAGGQVEFARMLAESGTNLTVGEYPIGVNHGPWSLARVQPDGDGTLIVNGQQPLLLQHWHELRPCPPGKVGRNPVVIGGESFNLTDYPIDLGTLHNVYLPQVHALDQACAWLDEAGIEWRPDEEG